MFSHMKQRKQNKKLRELQKELGKEGYLNEITILLGEKRMATRDEDIRRRAILLAELIDGLEIKETEIQGIMIREAADFIVDSHYLPAIIRLIKMYDSIGVLRSSEEDKARVKKELLELLDDMTAQLERIVKHQNDAKLAEIDSTVSAMRKMSIMNQRLDIQEQPRSDDSADAHVK